MPQLLAACVADSNGWLLLTTCAQRVTAGRLQSSPACCVLCWVRGAALKGRPCLLLLWVRLLWVLLLPSPRLPCPAHTNTNTQQQQAGWPQLHSLAVQHAQQKGCKRLLYLCFEHWRVFWLIVAAVVLQLVAVLAVDLHAGLWAPAQQQTCTMLCAVSQSGNEERVGRPTRPLQAQECPQADSNCCTTGRRAASPRGC